MKTILATAAVAAVSATQAQEAAFQLSLTPQIAIHPESTFVRGVSLGIWSENPQQSFTLGFVNGSTGESAGVSLAFGLNYAESYTGVHWGLVNYSSGAFTGWQSGCVNLAGDAFTGLQSGFVNAAQNMRGLQWGFVNYAESLHGVQIGLVNVVMDNPWFDAFPDKLAKGFPIVNWSF